MPVDLSRFDVTDRIHCRVGLARAVHGAVTLEDAAQASCQYLYDNLLVTGDGAPARASALVRCFKTHPYGFLEPALQRSARELVAAGNGISADMPCLTLIASCGDEPAWCSRHRSRRRRCLPLESPSALARAPMWSRFFQESGVDTSTLCRPRSPEFVDRTPRAVNVFCVEQAAGSASIPDQDEFVSRYGIQSVVGFWCQLRRGDLFALVAFSKVAVSREVAARMRPIAIDLTSTFFQFADDQIFSAAPFGREISRPDDGEKEHSSGGGSGASAN